MASALCICGVAFSLPNQTTMGISRYVNVRMKSFFPSTTFRIPLKGIRASERDLLGDFGARDPFPAEIESKFGEKVLGNLSTEHKILVPNASALSLAQQDFVPVEHSMSEDEARKLLFKVVGWKLVNEEGVLKLQGVWKVKDAQCGEELINRIKKEIESTGHVPVFHLQGANQVRAELWSCSIGGLSINDFIVAAKIDLIQVADLQPKLRVWA